MTETCSPPGCYYGMGFGLTAYTCINVPTYTSLLQLASNAMTSLTGSPFAGLSALSQLYGWFRLASTTLM